LWWWVWWLGWVGWGVGRVGGGSPVLVGSGHRERASRVHLDDIHVVLVLGVRPAARQIHWWGWRTRWRWRWRWGRRCRSIAESFGCGNHGGDVVGEVFVDHTKHRRGKSNIQVTALHDMHCRDSHVRTVEACGGKRHARYDRVLSVFGACQQFRNCTKKIASARAHHACSRHNVVRSSRPSNRRGWIALRTVVSLVTRARAVCAACAVARASRVVARSALGSHSRAPVVATWIPATSLGQALVLGDWCAWRNARSVVGAWWCVQRWCGCLRGANEARRWVHHGRSTTVTNQHHE